MDGAGKNLSVSNLAGTLTRDRKNEIIFSNRILTSYFFVRFFGPSSQIDAEV